MKASALVANDIFVFAGFSYSLRRLFPLITYMCILSLMYIFTTGQYNKEQTSFVNV